MSLMSSDIKLGQDVDPTVRRFQAAITRDLEQLYLLMGQGLGGFSNESPGAVSQDVNTNGMGVEANQGDYTFSGPASAAQVAQQISGLDLSGFLQVGQNLSDVQSASTSRTNLGLGTMATVNSPVPILNGGTASTNATAAAAALTMMFCGGAAAVTAYSTAGTSTHTFLVGAKMFLAFIVGGGGGGSAATTASGSGQQSGSGGGSGSIIIVYGKITTATVTVLVGAGGAGGAASLGSGLAGSISTLTIAGGPISATAGTGAASSPGLGGVYTAYPGLNYFRIALSGQNGGQGCVKTFAYNGTGNITGITTSPGRGGRGLGESGAGSGGNGGDVGGDGSPGTDGSIVIVEF